MKGPVKVEHYESETEVAPGDVAGDQARYKDGPQEAADGETRG